MTQEKIFLIVGAEGRIGSAISQRLRAAGNPLIETVRVPAADSGKAALDLARDVSRWRPSAAVSTAWLCAAVTSQESCRKDPEGCARVNVENTVVLAANLVADGAFVVFPSTNLVFDGASPRRVEGDPVSPRTEYGRLKAEAEKRLLKMEGSVAVVRLTKVVAPGMPLFAQWIRALRAGETIRPFRDMVFSPVPMSFAVEALYQIGERREAGIFHVSGEKDITYEDAARFIADRLGVDQALVKPITAKEAGLPHDVAPPHTTLDTSRLTSRLGMTPPDVWSTMETALDT